MLSFKFDKKGFTLVELLLYIGLNVIMLLAVVFFITVLLQTRIKNQTIGEVEEHGVQIMQTVTQAVRNAKNVELLNQNILRVTDANGALMDFDDGSFSASKLKITDLVFQILSDNNSRKSVRITFNLSRLNSEGKNEYKYSANFYATASLRQ